MKKLEPEDVSRLESIRCDLLYAEMEVGWILDSAAAFLEEIGVSVPADEVRDKVLELRDAAVKNEQEEVK